MLLCLSVKVYYGNFDIDGIANGQIFVDDYIR